MPIPRPQGTVISIYRPEAGREGLLIVEKANWLGRGLVCPRAAFPEVRDREEFDFTGVYCLLGPSCGGERESVYVGQSDRLGARLLRHQAEQDFWTSLVAFVNRDNSLNRAQVLYLEARLVQEAAQARRATLENTRPPGEPSLSESERVAMEHFLADMLDVLPVLGVRVFEPIPARSPSEQLLYLRSRDLLATGYESPQGFVIRAGSQASVTESELAVNWLSRQRAELREQGVLVDRGEYLEFARDCEFRAPSTAGGVILGHEINGREAWKDERGRTLKQIQEEQTAG